MPVTASGPEDKRKKTVTVIRPVHINKGEGEYDIARVGDVLTLSINDANMLISAGQAVEGEQKVNREALKRWEEKEENKKKRAAVEA